VACASPPNWAWERGPQRHRLRARQLVPLRRSSETPKAITSAQRSRWCQAAPIRATRGRPLPSPAVLKVLDSSATNGSLAMARCGAGQMASHVYEQPGTYIATFVVSCGTDSTVTPNQQNIYSDTTTVTIRPPTSPVQASAGVRTAARSARPSPSPPRRVAVRRCRALTAFGASGMGRQAQERRPFTLTPLQEPMRWPSRPRRVANRPPRRPASL